MIYNCEIFSSLVKFALRSNFINNKKGFNSNLIHKSRFLSLFFYFDSFADFNYYYSVDTLFEDIQNYSIELSNASIAS